mmetsp:Transcript_129277/g.223403  ORF Transcript_129277/g.223403 Transcript_129277/m.223403 type:complete len:202 (+) Transcript_129277:675-1280(+)
MMRNPLPLHRTVGIINVRCPCEGWSWYRLNGRCLHATDELPCCCTSGKKIAHRPFMGQAANLGVQLAGLEPHVTVQIIPHALSRAQIYCCRDVLEDHRRGALGGFRVHRRCLRCWPSSPPSSSTLSWAVHSQLPVTHAALCSSAVARPADSPPPLLPFGTSLQWPRQVPASPRWLPASPRRLPASPRRLPASPSHPAAPAS